MSNVKLQSVSQKIIGAPLELGFPSVCQLEIEYQKGSVLNKYTSMCSGVLVSPTLVLTAAHTFEGKINKVAYVLCKFKTLDNKTVYRKSAKVLLPSLFRKSQIEKGKALDRAKGSLRDYAVIVLSEPLYDIEPAPILPFSTLKALYDVKKVDKLIAVGFGRYTFVSKYKTKTAQNKKRSYEFEFEIYPGIKAFKVLPPETKAPSGETISTHLGDSGGAYFINLEGVNYLIGLISSVTTRAKSRFENDALFATGLSTDNPYSGYYKRFFKHLTQSSGPLGYGYKAESLANIPKLPKTPNIPKNPPRRKEPSRPQSEGGKEALTLVDFVKPTIVAATVISLAILVRNVQRDRT